MFFARNSVRVVQQSGVGTYPKAPVPVAQQSAHSVGEGFTAEQDVLEAGSVVAEQTMEPGAYPDISGSIFFQRSNGLRFSRSNLAFKFALFHPKEPVAPGPDPQISLAVLKDGGGLPLAQFTRLIAQGY